MDDKITELLTGAALGSTSKTYQRGEQVKFAGSMDKTIYYIKSGCIRIHERIEEEEVTIRFGYQGDYIADLESAFQSITTNTAITALRKSVLIEIQYDELFNANNLELINRILKDLIIQQIEREKDLLIDDAVQRYERVIHRSPQLFQEVPAKYIASYLRMSPETLSRIRSNY